MTSPFLQCSPMLEAGFDALPPIVRKGEDLGGVIDRLVGKWAESLGNPADPKYTLDEHVKRGGFILEDVAFFDENTQEAVNLTDILARLEERTMPAEEEPHRVSFVLIRRCRIDAWRCESLSTHASLAFHDVQFSGGISLKQATFYAAIQFTNCSFNGLVDFDTCQFRDRLQFAKAFFYGPTSFGYAAFGGYTTFADVSWRRDVRFVDAVFGHSAVFSDIFADAVWNLDAAHFRANATFVDCHDGKLSLAGARIDGSLGFRRCHFQATLDRSHVTGDVRFAEVSLPRLMAVGTVFGDFSFHGELGSGSELRECEFRGETDFEEAAISHQVTFAGARFNDRASFERATIGEQCDFSSAVCSAPVSFRGASFKNHANFGNARFAPGADFSDAVFGFEATFEQARFAKNACFENVSFRERASFEGAEFEEAADFTKAQFGFASKFTNATFGEGSTFRSVDFGSSASFREADVGNADLRDAKRFLPDNTYVKGAQFSPRARDPWSILRRTYTGPRMVFTLVFLIAFFVPYFARTAGWVWVGRAQERVQATLVEIRTEFDSLQVQDPRVEEFAQRSFDTIQRQLPHVGSRKWYKSNVLNAVLGFDRGLLFGMTAVALLIFNVIRASVTFVVAPMRDAEERSGYTPMLRGGHLSESYAWLMWLHWVASTLFWVSIGAFLFHMANWLSQPVWIPA